jgi:hypothetical protein
VVASTSRCRSSTRDHARQLGQRHVELVLQKGSARRGGAGEGLAPIDDGDLEAGPGQALGQERARDAGADHEDFVETLPFIAVKGTRGFGASSQTGLPARSSFFAVVMSGQREGSTSLPSIA